MRHFGKKHKCIAIILASLLGVVLLRPGTASAWTVSSDRPDFADATSTVPVGILQVESGYSYGRSGGEGEHTFGEWMLRTGLGNRSDIRLGVNSYLHDGASGFGDGSLDFRYRLRESDADRGARSLNLTLIAGTGLPSGSRKLRARHLQPAVMLTSDLQLGGGVALAPFMNWVLASGETDQYSEFSSGASLVFQLDNRTSAYMEGFGTFAGGEGREDIGYAGAGMLWLARNDLQLDIHFLSALNGQTPNYRFGFGVSFFSDLR